MTAPSLSASFDRRTTRQLAAGFAVLAAVTYGLIVLGALVRAHHAGLACPDWPQCFGVWLPRFNLQIAFEWSHRLLAGSVSVVFVALAGLTLHHHRGGEPSTVRWLLLAAAGLLGLQIVLGGLTVLNLLASWTVTSHLVTGNAFALCLAFTAKHLFEISTPTAELRSEIAPRLRTAVTGCAVALLAQLVLGGLVSSNYAGLACSEWPTCEAGVWVPGWAGGQGIHLLHRFNAYLLLMAVAATAWLGRRTARDSLSRLLGLAFGLVLLQVGVGVTDVLLRLPPEVTGLHTGLAALITLCLGLAVRESWMRPRAAAH